MSNAKRDNNRIATLNGILFSDGVTLVPIAIDAGNNMRVNEVDTVSASIVDRALRDGNFETCLMAVSSVDGTPIPVFVDADGKVLVDT